MSAPFVVSFFSRTFYPEIRGTAYLYHWPSDVRNGRIKLHNNKFFQGPIIAEQVSDENKYIQSATLNVSTPQSKELNHAWFAGTWRI